MRRFFGRTTLVALHLSRAPLSYTHRLSVSRRFASKHGPPTLIFPQKHFLVRFATNLSTTIQEPCRKLWQSRVLGKYASDTRVSPGASMVPGTLGGGGSPDPKIAQILPPMDSGPLHTYVGGTSNGPCLVSGALQPPAGPGASLGTPREGREPWRNSPPGWEEIWSM
jgi:hypothetical protein